MYCAACGKEVTLGDSRCAFCGADLMELNAITYDRPLQRGGEEYRQSAKKMVMDEVAGAAALAAASLGSDERRMLMPFFEQRLKPLLSRYGSDEEFDKVFEQEIIPSIIDLEDDPATKPFLREIDGIIAEKLGPSAYQHYRSPAVTIRYNRKSQNLELSGSEVLQVLRVGELSLKFLEASLPMHRSATMFPFCKAAEMSCWLHSCSRYNILGNSDDFRKIVHSAGRSEKGFSMEGSSQLPDWLSKQQGTIHEVISAFYWPEEQSEEFRLNVDSVSNSRRVGIALYIFGRTWTINIIRKEQDGKEFSNNFLVENLFRASGTEREKTNLAGALDELQVSRNRSAHLDNIKTLDDLRGVRDLSYLCLSRLPQVLPFMPT